MQQLRRGVSRGACELMMQRFRKTTVSKALVNQGYQLIKLGFTVDEHDNDTGFPQDLQ